MIFGSSEALNIRENTAIASESSEIMILKRTALESVLNEFPQHKKEMIKLTREKQRYYKFLREEVRKRYSNLSTIKGLIKLRMQQPFITTHLSLKRQLKKSR